MNPPNNDLHKNVGTHGLIQEVQKHQISPRSIKDIIIHCLEKYQTKRRDGEPWDFSISSISVATGLHYNTIQRAIPTLRKHGILKLHGWIILKTHPMRVLVFHPEALPKYLSLYNKIDTKMVSIYSADNEGLTEKTPPLYNKIDTKMVSMIDTKMVTTQEDGVQEQELLSIKGENTYPNTNVSMYPSGSNSAPQLLPNPSMPSVSKIGSGDTSMPSAVSPNPSMNLAEQFEAFFTTSSASALGQDPTPPRQYHDREYMTSVPHSSTLGRYDTLGGK